ncbi:hypothetical protein KL951_002564 [Ogataea haglerorum]|nr:hypothetical protein KL951_002564 [Ogataea haglerorum]
MSEHHTDPIAHLSEPDKAKFEAHLVRSSSFRFKCTTRSGKWHAIEFPRYFGTDEEEFTKFRWRAFAHRRAVTTPPPKPKWTTAATTVKPAAMKWSAVVQEGLEINKKPNGVVPASIAADASLKPLGVVLLRLMYDTQRLPQHAGLAPHGLVNNGNICYMNAVLQALFACRPFSQMLYAVQHLSLGQLESHTPIMDALVALHDAFNKPSPEVLTPTGFYGSIARLPRFSHLKWGRQEDAEEFLGYLLDGLHEEFVDSIKRLGESDIADLVASIKDPQTLKTLKSALEMIKTGQVNGSTEKEDNGWMEVGANQKMAVKRQVDVKPSPVVQMFGGHFRSVLQVPNNKKSSITLDPFMHVQLEISDKDINDLYTAFEKFATVEEISYGDQTAKKQNLIDKLPTVLIIHLKRFSFVANDDSNENFDDYEIVSSKQRRNKTSASHTLPPVPTHTKTPETGGRIEKLHKKIEYPHRLTLPASCISPNVMEEPTYRLTAVVYHHGRSTEEGHYTADVLGADGSWTRVDDTLVTRISADDAVENGHGGGATNGKSAYILMYEKAGV